MIKKLFLTLALLILPSLTLAQSVVHLLPATDVGHSHSTGATITLTAGTGFYIVVTGVDISNCATGTAVTAAAPTYITTTNITGSPQFQVGSGVTAGLCQPQPQLIGSSGLKSTTAGTNVTFVLPSFATNQVISVNVYYYRVTQ